MTIGQRIRKIRREREISQDKLSKDAEIGKTTLLMIEKDKRNPNWDSICRIARVFNMPVEELVAGVNEFVKGKILEQNILGGENCES